MPVERKALALTNVNTKLFSLNQEVDPGLKPVARTIPRVAIKIRLVVRSHSGRMAVTGRVLLTPCLLLSLILGHQSSILHFFGGKLPKIMFPEIVM